MSCRCDPGGGHDRVLASGRCGGCGQVVLAAGAMTATDAVPTGGWQTAGTADPLDAVRCPAGGVGHSPGDATGVCTACGTQVAAMRAPSTVTTGVAAGGGEMWWFDLNRL